jgi:hypothetical protein
MGKTLSAVCRACLGDYAGGSAELDQVLKMAWSSRNQNAETMAYTVFAMIRVVAGKYPEAMGAGQAAPAVAEKSGEATRCFVTPAIRSWHGG